MTTLKMTTLSVTAAPQSELGFLLLAIDFK